MADTQDTTMGEHHPDTLIFRTQQMALDEPQHTGDDPQGESLNQLTLPLPTKQDTLPEAPSPTPAPRVRNIQHLIRRRERRVQRSDNPPSRPDYAARNLALQSHPRARRMANQATPYTSVRAEMSSQIINDLIERPAEIDRYLRKYRRWFQLNFARDDGYWHEYKAEWCVWQHFYKNHAKRDAFPGVQPTTLRAYSKRERVDIYSTEKLRHAFKGASI